ncbi:helix-turn-helix domain-containing protein [Arsenicicoccus bolidensis]|nr:helix-turn-helix transcriptional regulator [Arsenicicoccus bolidensis]
MPKSTTVRTTDMRSVVSAAIRVAMARLGLDQARLAERMSALGQPWHRQTVGSVVRGARRVTAEELLPLSLALECSMSELIAPADPRSRGTLVSVADGIVVPASDVDMSAGIGSPSPFLYWEGDRPRSATQHLVEAMAGVTHRTTAQARNAARATAEAEAEPYDERAVRERALAVLRVIEQGLAEEGAPLGLTGEDLRQLVQDLDLERLEIQEGRA